MQRKGQPIMILTCVHESHYFEERTIVVNDTVKVGRAVARTKAALDNAIFDCKVLSRNHAIIWFNADEFWLRDTNSSNGTFVNNTRVSKREDGEHCDRQIFSGDVIRFGVDVVEHDTTHGCIIASATLILPNGQEARPKLGHTGDALPAGLVSINNEQMFQISCYLNEAIFREQAIDRKLETLRQALQQAALASELGWQAMLNEEKLLQKFDLYESQMRLFKEDLSENSLKLKLSNLLEEKSLQEAESKNQLTSLIKEKETALQRIKDLERTIEDLREECKHLRKEYSSAQDACSNISEEYKNNLSTISQRLNELSTERNQLNDQLQHASQENGALKEQLEHVTHELSITKELHEQSQLKGSPGRGINGLPYVDEIDKELDLSVNSKDDKPSIEIQQLVDHVSGDELQVDSSKAEVNAYISDSIRDFHRALELIRLLSAKISALDVTTDLDEEKSAQAKLDAAIDSTGAGEVTNEVSSLSNTSASALASSTTVNSSSPSCSIDSLVKCIVRHNEAALTSLHAYLRQVNPSAAAELINKVYLSNSGVDENLEASALAEMESDKTCKRPAFLTLHNLANNEASIQPTSAAMAAAAAPSSEGVTVVGADSLCASPTVSSGNGSLSFSTSSPDADEVAHLRECVRIANEEIEHYKAQIAELQKSGSGDRLKTASTAAAMENDEKAPTSSEQDLEAMHAECFVLHARLGEIEEQLAQTRENHRRLVEEAHHHRDEADKLRAERAQLEAALAEAQAQIARLRASSTSSSATNNHTPANNTSATTTSQSAASTSYAAAHVDRLELAPSRLVTASSLTVIPLMLLVFAVMFAIFSKFSS